MILGKAKSIRESLSKTRQSVFGQVAGLFGAGDIDDIFWEDLEALLIQGDVGVKTTLDIVNWLQEQVEERNLWRTDQVETLLRERLVDILKEAEAPYLSGDRLLRVIFVVGVNGSGKTTTIGKLAHMHNQMGDRIVLAAGDTFRAAAIDQLKIWGERVGADVVAHQPGSDPGAVVFDAIKTSFGRREASVVIIDTAGRLQTQHNLMQELAKIRGIASKQVHRAPHETLLIIDATTGQNALSQAEKFKEIVDVSGVVLTKLDSTAKGGMAIAVAHDLNLPIKFIGTGEKVEDLQQFDAEEFVAGLFATNSASG